MANPKSVFVQVYFPFLPLVLSGATSHLCDAEVKLQEEQWGNYIWFLCWSSFPRPIYHCSNWYEVQQRKALPFLVCCSLKWGELRSLFSRLPVRFSWCFWVRSKAKRTGTSSAAALLIQHSLLMWLTVGNSLTFLTLTILTTSLCNSSEACLFQDATAKTNPLKTYLKAGSDVPSSWAPHNMCIKGSS